MRNAVALAVVGLTVFSGPAAASNPFPAKGWYLSVGGPIAYSSVSSAASGASIGAELSVVCWLCEDLVWAGAYADIAHDTGADHTRVTLGPEIGYPLVGLDGGLLWVADAEQPTFGLAGRLLATFGLLAIYFRGGGTFGDYGFTYVESGLLWKIPVPLYVVERSPRKRGAR